MHTERSYEILEQTLSVISLANPLVAAIQRKDRDAEEWWFFNHSSASSKDRDLASQDCRALSSVGLNVAEAFGTAAGNGRLRFETARGSLYEAQAGIRIAVAWGYFTQQQAEAVLAAMDALGGRVYGGFMGWRGGKCCVPIVPGNVATPARHGRTRQAVGAEPAQRCWPSRHHRPVHDGSRRGTNARITCGPPKPPELQGPSWTRSQGDTPNLRLRSVLSRAHRYRRLFLPSGWRAMLRTWVLPPTPRIPTIDLFESLPSFPQPNAGLSSSPRWRQLPNPAIA